MPRSRDRPIKSRRKPPCRPSTRCRKHKTTQSAKTHSSPFKNTLSQLPQLTEILGNKNELLGNIDKLSKLEASELEEKIKKIDKEIKKNQDSSKSMDLNRQRISLLTAYLAKKM